MNWGVEPPPTTPAIPTLVTGMPNNRHLLNVTTSITAQHIAALDCNMYVQGT